MNEHIVIKVEHIFNPDSCLSNWSSVTRSGGAARLFTCVNEWATEITLDRFDDSSVACCFTRSFNAKRITFIFEGNYCVSSTEAGGWIIASKEAGGPAYWVPQFPVGRKINPNGHILSEIRSDLAAFDVTNGKAVLSFEIEPDTCLDCLMWKIPAGETVLGELKQFSNIERSPVFLWGSHTLYRKPADLYSHLVNGHVYENRFAWPHRRRICSENDAHALYVVMSGLELSTGKRIYRLLKEQIVLSVMARQDADGGWRHGEWTGMMECHYRLHTSAMHLMMDALEEQRDPEVLKALERAVGFIAERCEKLRIGSWFLHDSLEHSTEAMAKSPFRWIKSSVLGKSPSNMLVLNTHLDTTIALARYARLTGDSKYDYLISSACSAAQTILNLRPVEWLYRPLVKALYLSLLPTESARRLSLPARALKRFGWKYLAPKVFHRFKTLFPRLAMPGGYIDRALSIGGLADDYQSVNLMDLLRHQRIFNDANLDPVLKGALDFTYRSGIRGHWEEVDNKRYALGFWAESLYHLCMMNGDATCRCWLAEAIQDLEDQKLGLPPSLLGANREAVKRRDQIACPSPVDDRLRVANLSGPGKLEFLVVNPTEEEITLAWENDSLPQMLWRTQTGPPGELNATIHIPPRNWIWGSKDLKIGHTPCA